jgi:CubicO group peptidase (beta-lactamase class C family)
VLRRVVAGLGLTTLVAALGFGIWSVHTLLPRATGYAAKIGCSARYLSGRAVADIEAQELAQVGFVGLSFDDAGGRVSASVWGLARQDALVRGSAGCVLEREGRAEASGSGPTARSTTLASASSEPWPLGDGEDARADPAGLDRVALDQAIDAAFAPELATRAVLVVHDGRLIAERYADGFGPATPLPGWSMAKSVGNALVGILVGRGQLELDAPAPVPEWREDPDDPRAAITLDQLLRMSSGLAWEERYGPFGAGSDMLFVDRSCASLAIAQPLAATPGTVFQYSSGTANIVARIVRDQFADAEAQQRWFAEALLEPLGLRSAVLELDPSGTFIASSFAMMSARDWARFGQLYLDDGVWQGQRILPEGWVAYTRTPGPAATKGEYGALFQTNAGAPGDRRLPRVPSDAFEMVGYEGQSVLIVPSRAAVIVRLGLTRAPAVWDEDAFAAAVLAGLPTRPT